MSANFFKINRGINLDPQDVTGSGDPIGTDGDIYYNDILNKFRKFENGSWSDIGSGTGGGGGANARADNESIPIASTSLVVTFSSALSSTTYQVLVDMVNTVDPFPQYQSVTVTNKTTTGFTVKWNAPTATANYSIDYVVPGNTVSLAEEPVPMGSTSLTANLSLPFSSSNYAIIAMLQNTVDPFPQYQPVTVIAKTATTFTVKWNAPTATANYVITYQAMEYV